MWKSQCLAFNMKQKIDFLSPPTGQDDYGEPNTTWTTFKASVWASKEPLLGNEFIEANAKQSEVEVKFRTRYFAGVKNEMRIKHGTETYEILSAINVKTQNRELLCYCKLVI